MDGNTLSPAKNGYLFNSLLMLGGSVRVLMLALEGGYGVRTMRLTALAQYYNMPLAELRGRFQIVEIKAGGMFDMSDPACVTAFAKFVKAGGWTDVFIDTQHRSAGALEENSATDARLFWNAVEVLRGCGNCNIVLAHHTGKDKTKGGRGSSADKASVDQQIALEFDRHNMTVAAEVTARKDGADGFTVHFKVDQPNPNAVPIIVPMSAEEYQAIADSEDRTAPREVAVALQGMERIGKSKHCSSTVLATEILSLHGELPEDPEQRQKVVKNLVNRLQARAQKDARLQAYSRKDGIGRTAPWLWYLPDQ
jgi:hypothetical protein